MANIPEPHLILVSNNKIVKFVEINADGLPVILKPRIRGDNIFCSRTTFSFQFNCLIEPFVSGGPPVLKGGKRRRKARGTRRNRSRRRGSRRYRRRYRR